MIEIIDNFDIANTKYNPQIKTLVSANKYD